MNRLLTPEEISALTDPRTEGTAKPVAPPVIAYNFRRPDRVSKEQMRSLHLLHERFARNATTSLAAFLRTTTEISLVSVEQYAYSEFLMAIPDPTALYGLSMAPFETLGAAEINPAVAFAMIDRMLGGRGNARVPDRALTEIEHSVVDSAMKLLLDELSETWHSVTEIRFQIHSRETRPQMLQVASWNEVMILLAFDVRVGETRGLLHFCVPASIVEVAGTGFVQSWQQTRRELSSAERRWLTDNIGRIPLTVAADIETRLTSRELVALAPGHVLSLGVPLDADVNVKVGDVLKFKGRLGTAGERAVVQISRCCAGPVTEEGT